MKSAGSKSFSLWYDIERIDFDRSSSRFVREVGRVVHEPAAQGRWVMDRVLGEQRLPGVHKEYWVGFDGLVDEDVWRCVGKTSALEHVHVFGTVGVEFPKNGGKDAMMWTR